MKSYKLNKTLENSTYPIEQELKKINRSTRSGSLKTIAAVSTVVFSGIATNFIDKNELFVDEIDLLIKKLGKFGWNISRAQIFGWGLFLIYVICIIINIIIYLIGQFKEQPRSLKKKPCGRKQLSIDFHKSIINDIVVGLSFLDKTNEEDGLEVEISRMYLFEATYYFFQAETQIELMELFDDKREVCNKALIDEIGYETLLTTLSVFQNGVKNVMLKMPEQENEMVEYKRLKNIYENLEIHINLLKGKQYKEKKLFFGLSQNV